MAGSERPTVLVVGDGDRAQRLVDAVAAPDRRVLRADDGPTGLATVDAEPIAVLAVTDGVERPAEVLAVAAGKGSAPAELYVGRETRRLPPGAEGVPADPDAAARAVDRLLLERAARAAEPATRADPLAAYGSTVAHELRNHVEAASLALEADDPDRVGEALDRLSRLADEAAAVAAGDVEASEAVSVAAAAETAAERLHLGPLTLDVRTEATVAADRSLLTLLFENCLRNAVEHAAGAGTDGRSVDPFGGPDERASGSNGNNPAGDAPDEATPAIAPNEAAAPAAAPDEAATLATAPNEAAAPGTGSVTVVVKETEGGFAIVDDGPGFGIERPFEWGVGGGTGAGLAVVRRIAEAHGWTVRASDDDGARIDVAVGQPPARR